MKTLLRSSFVGLLITSMVIGFIGLKDVSSGPPLEPAEEAYSMMYDLCDMAGYGINSGIHAGPTADKAAYYILKKLHKAGLMKAKLEPIKTNSPYPDKFELNVSVEGQAPQKVLSFPLQWTVGTPSGGITGQLAYVGDGSASWFQLVDVNGKIALIDETMMRGYSPTSRSNGAVVKAKNEGAIAIIMANMQIDVPQFQKNYPTRPPEIFPIPVFSVGKSVGDYLRNIALAGTTHSINMILDVPYTPFDGFNVVFELPGNGSIDETILVGSHYDTGLFTGAVDNNGSVALMIKWAEYFARKPKKERNRDMIFAWCSGHDFENNTGHYQFAEAHKEQLEKAIVWDVDHAAVGLKYYFDEIEGKIVPTTEDNEFYIISNNYVFTRLTQFTWDKYKFVSTQNRFGTSGSGPQWGMAPGTSPWVNAATIPIYYHSMLDTPDKITLDQMKRAYAAHIELLENVDKTPEGFIRYDNNTKDLPNTPPEVRIEISSEVARVGDSVMVWNDSYYFYDDKAAFHYPGYPEWVGTNWDWGDGLPVTIGGPMVTHVYQNPGVYTITMTFTDREGASGTATRQVQILPMP
ncbi:MAG: M28 family peptidase [Syntrophorhabdus sp.]